MSATTTPAIAPSAPAAGALPPNVISGFFYAPPITEASDADIAAAKAAGATDAELGTEPTTTPSSADPGSGGTGTAGGDRAAGTAAAAPAAGAAPTGPAAERITALEAQIAELNAQAATDGIPAGLRQLATEKVTGLEKELADLKSGAVPAVAPVTTAEIPAPAAPVAGRPLALVRGDQDLEFLRDTAKQVRTWARQNLEGGEMPSELRGAMTKVNQLVTGNKDAKLGVDDYLEPKVVSHFLGLAESMIEEQLPAHRDFLAAERDAFAIVRAKTPAYFDKETTDGKLFAEGSRKGSSLDK